MKDQNVESEVYEIDLLRLLKVLWQHAALIAAATVLVGILALTYARFLVTPLYRANALLYVNNSSISLGGASLTFSASELNAAKSLVDTYTVILKTRTTLNAVIRRSGVDYTYEQLNRMVSASAVNNTEIFSVTVTSPDREEAKLLANTIAEVLPEKIGDIVEGSNVSVVDLAVTPSHRSSPSYTKYVAVGMLLGFVLSVLVIILMDLFDDVIRDEEYLLQTYHLPILGTIPDLLAPADEKGGYGSYGSYGARTGRK